MSKDDCSDGFALGVIVGQPDPVMAVAQFAIGGLATSIGLEGAENEQESCDQNSHGRSLSREIVMAKTQWDHNPVIDEIALAHVRC